MTKKEDHATILEIYRIFVVTVTAAENQRHRASTVYLGMIVALATVTSALESIRPWSMLGAMSISVVWFLSVYSFRQLAIAKFHVIKILEAKLPIAAFGTEEEERRRRKRIKGIDLTHLEMTIPILVFFVCVVMLLLSHHL